jgi:hypothetical protein
MLKNKLLVLFGVLLVLFSCKAPQSLSYTDITNISDIKLRKSLIDNEITFDKLFLKKVNFTFDNGNEKKTFKGSFVIQNDSVIIASIYALMGIELVRVKFTSEEVIVIDKHKKKVTKTDYDYFNNKLGIDLDYKMLQSILSNTLFIYPSESDFYSGIKKYKHYINKDSYSFKSIKDKKRNRITKRNKNNVVVHEINILPGIYRISNVFLKDFNSNQSLTIDYSEFNQFDNILFPKEIKLKGSKGINTIDITLKINYLEVNDGGSLHFKIPSTYKMSEI